MVKQKSRYGMTIPLPDRLDDHKEIFRELVELGYTDVWSSEANDTDGLTPLALAAAWAPELRLGTAILPAFTRGPALLAQSAAAMACAAPNNFVLGIGTSSDVIVERWNGIRFEDPYLKVRDTIRFLKKALLGEKISEEFETFNISGFRLARVPENQPPILLAALREGMLRLAGREADGAIINWLSAEDVERVAGIVNNEGPDKEIVARIFVCPSDKKDLVLAGGKFAMAAYLNVPVYKEFHKWLGREEMLSEHWEQWDSGDRKGALEKIPDSLVDELIVNGTPDQCRDHIQRYVTAGVTCPALAIMPLTGDDVRKSVRDLAPINK